MWTTDTEKFQAQNAHVQSRLNHRPNVVQVGSHIVLAIVLQTVLRVSRQSLKWEMWVSWKWVDFWARAEIKRQKRQKV